MSEDYGYINARLRARKGQFIPLEELLDWLEDETISNLANRLKSTPYDKDIQEGIAIRGNLFEGIEEGLKRNLSRDMASVRGITDGLPKQLTEIILERWELFNLKTIIRGKYAESSEETVLNLLYPTGKVEKAIWEELFRQPDIPSLIQMLDTFSIKWAKPLKKALPEFLATQQLTSLEYALDVFHFDKALQRLKIISNISGEEDDDESVLITKDALKMEIDALNLLTLLKTTVGRVPIEKRESLFLKGGKEISIERFKEAAARNDFVQAFNHFSDTSFSTYLQKGLECYQKWQEPSFIERAVEKKLSDTFQGYFRKNPLSIATVIAYIWSKVTEVSCIRWICTGKHFKLPKPFIQEVLTLG